MGAAASLGLGILLLILVEMQWVVVLWPLRVMALGAVGLGVLMAHSALSLKRRKLSKERPDYPRSVLLLQELVFWVVAAGIIGTLLASLYFI